MPDESFLDVIERCRADWDRERAVRAAAAGMTLEEYDAQEAAREAAEIERKRLRAREEAVCRALRRSGLSLPSDSEREIVGGGLREDTTPMRAVRRWLDSQIPALVLCGGVGTGKTVAAAAAVVARAMAEADRAESGGLRGELCVSGCRAAELGVRSAPYRDELSRVELVHLDAELFVLDDLGTEAKQDARFSEALFVLVDSRQTVRRRTLITTNLAPADIRPRYGDRVADRLNHIGRAVQCRGESLRRRGEL